MPLPRFSLVHVNARKVAVAELLGQDTVNLFSGPLPEPVPKWRLVTRPTTYELATRVLGCLARGQEPPLALGPLLIHVVALTGPPTDLP